MNIVFFTNKRSVIEILVNKENKTRKIWKEPYEARMRRPGGNGRPVFVPAVVLKKDLRSRPLSCVTHVIQ